MKQTTIEKVGKVTKITHSQSIRQSLNYNSADCSYVVEIECKEGEVLKTIARAEKIVEKALVPKAKEQQDLLLKISGK